MKLLITVLLMLLSSVAAMAYEPTEEEISEHRAKVYALASGYIKNTFKLAVTAESAFVPVRFDSKKLWGDFEARIEDLGDHWFEVHGWVSAQGLDREEVEWSVVLKYELVDPEAWRYRRLDREYSNEPVFSSWNFGQYSSVPYTADLPLLKKRFLEKMAKKSS